MFVGTNPSLDDIMSYTSTDTIHASTANSIHLADGQQLYVTITCSNWLNMKADASVSSVLLPTNPPSSETAFVDVIPNQYTYYKPIDRAQMDDSLVTFTYGGFGSHDVIGQYQYRLTAGGSSTDWISVGKLVRHILQLHIHCF